MAMKRPEREATLTKESLRGERRRSSSTSGIMVKPVRAKTKGPKKEKLGEGKRGLAGGS